MANKTKTQRYFEAVTEHPIEWVKFTFPEFEIDSLNERYFVELGKLITAKIKAAKGKDLTDQERQYSKKIGISIMSGQGVGKDAIAALTTLYFLDVFPFPKVLITAPSGNTLQDVIWAELSKWIRKSRKIKEKDSEIEHSILEDKFGMQSDKLYMRMPDKKDKEGREWFAVARTINTKASPDEQAETLSGRHEDFMLYVIDEACHDDKTEVMTDSGWKFFENLCSQDLLLTINPLTFQASYEKPSKYYRKFYDGIMYQLKNRAIDFSVTPDHEMWYKTKDGHGKWHWHKKPIKDIRSHEFYIKRDFNFVGEGKGYFILPSFTDGHNITHPSIKLNMDDWSRFLGWYYSEGSVDSRGYTVVISQKNKKKRDKIKRLIEKLGFRVVEGYNELRINSRRLVHYLLQYGRGFNGKRIPRYIFDLSPRQINLFLETYLLGDGYIKKNKQYKSKEVFYTSSPILASQLQELILKTGDYASVINRNIKGQVKWIQNHWATTKYDAFVISRSKEKSFIKIRRKDIRKEPYIGYIYCAGIDKHNLLYTRRNGKCMWSGNSGVPDPVFKPLEGTMTGIVNIALLIFNPTKSKGFAINSQYGDSSRWVCIRWNAEESPRVSREHIENMAEKYGKDSNPYRTRVLGLPPLADSNALIPWDWIEDAIDRMIQPLDNSPVIQGLDCGAGGDKSVLVTRKGGKVLSIKRNSTRDSEQLIGWARLNFMESEADMMNIDMIGIGWGIHGALRKSLNKFGARAVDSRGKAMRDDLYFNRRAEMYWNLRKAFEDKSISIPNDPELVDALSVIKSILDSKGRHQIEKKDRIKDALGHSPDEADALALSYAFPDRQFMQLKETEADAWRQKKDMYEDRRLSWMTA